MALDGTNGIPTPPAPDCGAPEVVIRDIPTFIATASLTAEEKIARLDAEIRSLKRTADAEGRIVGDAATRLMALIRAERLLRA